MVELLITPAAAIVEELVTDAERLRARWSNVQASTWAPRTCGAPKVVTNCLHSDVVRRGCRTALRQFHAWHLEQGGRPFSGQKWHALAAPCGVSDIRSVTGSGSHLPAPIQTVIGGGPRAHRDRREDVTPRRPRSPVGFMSVTGFCRSP
jgi:hypothetical protein